MPFRTYARYLQRSVLAGGKRGAGLLTQPHSRHLRSLRGALGRIAFYTVLAGVLTFAYIGFVAPEMIDGGGPREVPVVTDAGGAR